MCFVFSREIFIHFVFQKIKWKNNDSVLRFVSILLKHDIREEEKMPTVKVLQPVLKMKVDELFLCWLSEPATQVMLKDYLRSITNEEKIEIGSGDAGNTEHIFTEINCVSKQTMLGTLMSPLTPTSRHLSTALPLGTPASPRNISGIRGKRRSSSTRTVSAFTQVHIE